MSANPDVLRNPDIAGASAQETVRPAEVFGEKAAWNPEDFAREQIRGLVRQVFFSSRIPPVRQVVFSAAQPLIDVAGICEKVGWALAQETSASIAIVGREHHTPTADWRDHDRISPVKSRSTHIASNLWRVWGVASAEQEEDFRIRGDSRAARRHLERSRSAGTPDRRNRPGSGRPQHSPGYGAKNQTGPGSRGSHHSGIRVERENLPDSRGYLSAAVDGHTAA
jgi:hypothetical protein